MCPTTVGPGVKGEVRRGWLTLGMAGLALWSLWRWHAQEQAYLDDAWISFKYARALLAGQGLVYNPEDGPLEGFTNLAWVLLVAVGMRLGCAPEVFARALGLSSHLAVIGLIVSLAWRRGDSKPTSGLTTLLLAAIPGATSGLLGIAGSGLETAFAALLMVLLAELSERPRALPVVLVATVLCATRPDGLVFVCCYFGATWLHHYRQAGARRKWLGALLGFAGCLGALLGWKWMYFGALLPNTYYAKSADLPAWDIGWTYWRIFAQSEPGVAMVLASVVAFSSRRRVWSTYATSAALAYVVYVAKVGGDFMEYRFAYQLVPLLAWTAARSLLEVQAPSLRLAGVGVASMFLGFALLPPQLEHTYGMQSLELMNLFVVEGRSVGARLREVLPEDTRLSTTLAGTLPYEWGGFVVDEWGLTDRYVGRLPGMPVVVRGHVKHAPQSYLEQRRVNLVLGHPTICSCADGSDAPWPQVYVRLGGDRCLRAHYLSQTPQLTQLFCTDGRFRVRHVDCAADSPPEWATSPPGRAPGGATGEESMISEDPNLGGLQWTQVDSRQLLTAAHGTAFGAGPVMGALTGQSPVTGFGQGLINSFHGGDETTGWLQWQLPTDTRRVRGRVGGGAHCQEVFLGVLERGILLRKVCGHQSEQLSAFDIAVPPGAELALVDLSRSAWGHLLVSDLEVGQSGRRP